MIFLSITVAHLKETGSYAAIQLLGTDNTVIDHFIIEGSQPKYGIFF